MKSALSHEKIRNSDTDFRTAWHSASCGAIFAFCPVQSCIRLDGSISRNICSQLRRIDRHLRNSTGIVEVAVASASVAVAPGQ